VPRYDMECSFHINEELMMEMEMDEDDEWEYFDFAFISFKALGFHPLTTLDFHFFFCESCNLNWVSFDRYIWLTSKIYISVISYTIAHSTDNLVMVYRI
jgi:hypothetical protein